MFSFKSRALKEISKLAPASTDRGTPSRASEVAGPGFTITVAVSEREVPAAIALTTRVPAFTPVRLEV
jgi:hypothetical protein